MAKARTKEPSRARENIPNYTSQDKRQDKTSDKTRPDKRQDKDNKTRHKRQDAQHKTHE